MNRRRRKGRQPTTSAERRDTSKGRSGKSTGLGEKGGRKITASAVSGRKLWIFRLISLFVFPVISLILLEAGLRTGGYGFTAKVVVREKVSGVKCLVSNDSFARLFFPARLAREFDPFVIPVDKAENHCRIIVLGASAVQGVPDGAYSFSRMLELLLKQTYPSVEFEVSNTGMTAINSHSVVQIAKDLRGCKADVFVVYLGNNEVVGPYGAGTVFSPLRSSLSLIRGGIGLRRYRLGQFISALGSRGKDDKSGHWGGMKMYLEQQVRADDPQLEIVYDHFRKNLEDICSTANGMGAKVLLSTVGSNLRDCPPFVSMHGEGLDEEAKQKWEAIYQQGVKREQQGDVKGAVEEYWSCETIDNQFADLHFRLGRMYDRSGEYDEARGHYVKARELDGLRFRADDRINSIIREVAEKRKGKGVYSVDVVKALAEHSEHRIPGRKLFYEHVHMTFEGNAVIANAIMQGIEEVLPAWVQKERAETAKLQLEELAQRLAFTEGDRIISQEHMLNVYLREAPFTNQLYHTEQISMLEEKVKGLKKAMTEEAAHHAGEVCRKAIEHRPADWWLRWKYAGLLATQLKDINGAVEQCRSMLELVPQFRKGHVVLADLLEQTGQFEAAREHYKEALRLKPDDPAAAYGMGVLSSKADRLEEAVQWYRRAIATDSGHMGANLNLGEVLSRLGRSDEAIEVYRQAVDVLPESVDLHYNLGVLYYRGGQRLEALRHIRKAQMLAPESRGIRETLESMEGR